MKIGILGAGNIGSTLGSKWLAAGHTVIFGVRGGLDHPSLKAQAALQAAGVTHPQFALPAQAAAQSEVILFSVPWAAAAQLSQESAPALAGKILIDATNNFGGPVINNLAALQAAAPSAAIYRAFNSLGWEVFAHPEIGGQVVDHFYTGPDGASRPVVEALIRQVGLRPVWVGDNDRIQVVDALGALWVTLAFRQGLGRRIAFKLLEE
jgi:hypothetical protein